MAIFNIDYINEAMKQSTDDDQKYISVSFNGKSYKAELDIRKGSNEDLASNIKNIVKLINSKAVFDYLYSHHKNFLADVYEYENIKSGTDLMKAIYNIDLVTIKYDTVYVSGYCDWDQEHGFSVAFPNGKFVKSNKPAEYKSDYDENNHYQPRYTVLSGHASAY